MGISIEELKVIAAMTIKLTKLRQEECAHLCIENFAPELMAKLIDVLPVDINIDIDGGPQMLRKRNLEEL